MRLLLSGKGFEFEAPDGDAEGGSRANGVVQSEPRELKPAMSRYHSACDAQRTHPTSD